jgi:hypothetical protein
MALCNMRTALKNRIHSALARSPLYDRHTMAGRMGGLDPRLQSLSRGIAVT